MSIIRYEFFQAGWDNFYGTLEAIIERRGAKTVLEIGGGGVHQALTRQFVMRNGIQYTLLDISPEQLARAPSQYTKIEADIGSSDLHVNGQYDVICSHMLAEHIRDGELLHRNVYRLLAPGGVAYHFFPTLYAFPYLANRLLPESLGVGMLSIVQSGREPEGTLPKFPAFYSWCRGPTQSQIHRLENLGYRIEQYIGFFGHRYYEKISCLNKWHFELSQWLIRHPIAWLTSHASLTMSKPASGK
jgi:SAM-dependent methyltransferase